MNSLISILIVEDDAVIRAVLEMALAAEGFTKVSSCSRGDEGMDAIRRQKPDLVLLDVMLPDINGKEVCQRVRSDKTMDDVRIICISGMVEENRIRDLKESGANEFLQKPFDVDTLLKLICQHLDMEVNR